MFSMDWPLLLKPEIIKCKTQTQLFTNPCTHIERTIRPWQLSHNLTLAHSCGHGKPRGLGPTNPRVKSVDLHIHSVRFIVFQNHMVVWRLAHTIYIQVNNPLFYRCEILSHMWSISNNIHFEVHSSKEFIDIHKGDITIQISTYILGGYHKTITNTQSRNKEYSSVT